MVELDQYSSIPETITKSVSPISSKRNFILPQLNNTIKKILYSFDKSILKSKIFQGPMSGLPCASAQDAASIPPSRVNYD